MKMKNGLIILFVFCSTSALGQIQNASDYLIGVYNDIVYLKKTGQLEEAYYKASLTLEQHPGQADFYNLKAMVVLATGSINDAKNDQAAILLLDSAIQYAPNRAAFYNNRGWIYQIMDKYSLAEKDYDKAANIEPSNIDFQCNRLRLLYVRNRNKAAMALCDQLIAQFPEDGYAYYVRGNLKRDYLHKYVEGNKDIKLSKQLGWHSGIHLKY